MVFPNQPSSIFNKKNGSQSLYKGVESEPRPLPDRQGGDFREQASDLLNNAAISKQALATVRAESGSEGLHRLTLSNANDQTRGISESDAQNIGSSQSAIKGLNADGDQVNKMMELAPSAELFQELKEHDSDQALNYAANNPEFQRQALHDMGDESFQQEARIRLTGLDR